MPQLPRRVPRARRRARPPRARTSELVSQVVPPLVDARCRVLQRNALPGNVENEPVDMNAEIGVFGGSGFYSFLDRVEELEVDTPYGKPSAPLVVGEVAGRRVAFCPR